jgi:type II secretory ATPase GspE/PulE/Tfp pilus assembly ATPase PilB-like protein
MGVLPYQVAATVRLCVAQRLVRKLCVKCRQPRTLTALEAQMLARPDLAGAGVFEPGRCEACEGRGFRGRIGLFELLPVDDDLAARIVAGCDEGAILRYMAEKNIPRLRDDGAQKMLAGETSFSELMAVAPQ